MGLQIDPCHEQSLNWLGINGDLCSMTDANVAESAQVC